MVYVYMEGHVGTRVKFGRAHLLAFTSTLSCDGGAASTSQEHNSTFWTNKKLYSLINLRKCLRMLSNTTPKILDLKALLC